MFYLQFTVWDIVFWRLLVLLCIFIKFKIGHAGDLGCFHTSTFGAHSGSIDVTVRFVWMMWTLSSDLGCTPVNRTRVRLKRVVWGTVQVNFSTVRCWCERNRTKSRKWTTINAVLFDKNVCLCVSLTFLTSVTDTLQAECCMSHLCSLSAFFRAFAVHS